MIQEAPVMVSTTAQPEISQNNQETRVDLESLVLTEVATVGEVITEVQVDLLGMCRMERGLT